VGEHISLLQELEYRGAITVEGRIIDPSVDVEGFLVGGQLPIRLAIRFVGADDARVGCTGG
jgi:hypothetical protein